MDLGFLIALYGKRDRLERAAELAQPILEVLKPSFPLIQAALPELLDIGKEVAAVVWPDLQAKLASSQPLATFGVRDVQQAIVKLGDGIKVTGEYDEPTKAAVKRYQLSKGMTVDGWAGPATITALMVDVAKLPKIT